MNVADSLGDLTAQLAGLYASRGPTTRTDLDIDAALHGRAAVLGLARELLFWGTRSRHGNVPTLALLDTDPRRGLVWQVAHHPTPEATRSPLDVAAAAPRGSAAERWEQVATQATVVHSQWSTVTDKPTGPHVNTVLADVAALTLAVSHLDARLAVTAQTSGRPDVADALGGTAVSALRHASEATLRHLARGDLPAWRAQVALTPRRLEVLAVHNPAEVPRGLSRLASLLDAGTHVSPARLHHVLRTQQRITTLLTSECAALWRTTGDPAVHDTGRRLHDLGLSLPGAVRALRQNLASIEPSDPRPVLQAAECVRGLGYSRPAGLDGPAERAELLAHQASSLLYGVHEVGGCVRREVEAKRWLSSQWSEDDDVRPWTWLTQLDHPRIQPLLTLGDTALDLLTRPATAAMAPVMQPAMTHGERRWHALT